MTVDVCIIGGGIAGLALAIDLRHRGILVTVIEKGTYPRHKVCGEYISNESKDYLFSLCPSLHQNSFPFIDKFRLTSTGKKELMIPLALGGFGISRFFLEDALYREAINRGIKVIINQRASEAMPIKDGGYIVRHGRETIHTRVLCNAGGRYSGISKNKSAEYIAVKYHVSIQRDPSLIEIHNFPGGYCGISNVEDNKSCLCYIVSSEKLRQNGNDIRKMEQNILYKNIHLGKIFEASRFLTDTPVTASGINFEPRQPFEKKIFYVGDAAGTIAPITGNGMSMGLRATKSLAGIIEGYFNEEVSIEQAGERYASQWNRMFVSRIKLSRYFQRLSEFTPMTRFTISTLRCFPAFAERVVKKTHGLPF